MVKRANETIDEYFSRVAEVSDKIEEIQEKINALIKEAKQISLDSGILVGLDLQGIHNTGITFDPFSYKQEDDTWQEKGWRASAGVC